MKKILLASTALVLSAGIAQAQAVRITGEGRMGIIYETSRGTLAPFSGSNWIQENRLQFNFTVGVTADHGLSFGAFTRARMTNGTAAQFSGSRVWVEASNLRLTFGNVDGAIRGAGVSHGYAGGCSVGYVGGHYCGDTAGLIGLSSLGVAPSPYQTGNTIMAGQTQGFASQAGGPAARARLDYSFGETRIAISSDRGAATEFGIRSRFDAFTVALGYSNRASIATLGVGPATQPGYFSDLIGTAIVPGSVVALSGHYNGGSWGVGALVVRVSYSGALSAQSHTNWSLSGNVELGGGNLYGYVGRVTQARTGNPLNRVFNTAGVSYGYGLGGGATLTAGIERLSAPGFTFTSASVGVAFNF
jgi:hypothetical protein